MTLWSFLKTFRLPLVWAGLAAFALSGVADPPPAVTYPPWWLERNVVAAQPPDPAVDEPAFSAWQDANYQPANLGQLKHLAQKARDYLDDQLYEVGGAGPAIDTLVEGFLVSDEGDPQLNYAPVNLGQLKAVAQPFYQRLQAVGFDTRQHLLDRGAAPGEGQDFPWPAPPPGEGQEGYNGTVYSAWMAKNYQPANLGQLKLCFTFALDAWAAGRDWSAVDADGDGLPDAWELAHGLSPFDDGSVDADNGAAGDPDGDALDNSEEYNGGVGSTDPTDPVSGPEPPEDPPPAKPGSFTVAKMRPGEGGLLKGKLYLSWSPVAGNITYEIERRSPSATPGVPGAWGNLSPNITAGNTSCTATDATVALGHYYQYRLRARDGDTTLNSPWTIFPPTHYLAPEGEEGAEPDGNGEFAVDGFADSDDDGLTNDEEFEYATDPTNPDTDGDGALDGEDAFATDRDFAMARQPAPHYAVLDLGPGEVLDMNDDGDVLIKQTTVAGNVTTVSYHVWSAGNTTTLPASGDPDWPYRYVALSNRAGEDGPWALGWDGGELVPNRSPLYAKGGWEEPEFLAYETLFAALGQEFGEEEEAWLEPAYADHAGRIYFEMLFQDDAGATEGRLALARWNADGSVTVSATIPTVTAANPGATATLSLAIAEVPDGAGGHHTLSIERTRHYTYHNGTAKYEGGDLTTRLKLNGQLVPGTEHQIHLLEGYDNWIKEYFSTARTLTVWDGQPVVALTPAVLAAAAPAHTPNLVFQPAANATLQKKLLPADPKIRDGAAEIAQLAPTGRWISQSATLGTNSKEASGDALFPEAAAANISIGCYAAQPAGGVVGGAATYTESSEEIKQALVLVPVYIDPVSTHSFKEVAMIPLTEYVPVAELSLNRIKNPAIIVTGDTTHPAKLTATLEGLNPNKLRWQVDTVAGFNGTVTFAGGNETVPADYGSEIKVAGNVTGRVRFSLWYNYGNVSVPNLKNLSEVTLGNSTLKFNYCKYEAVVADKLTVKVRAQRLTYKIVDIVTDTDNPGDWDTLAPEADRINEHLKIANVILRQAGIELVWDDDDDPKYKINDVKSNTLVSDAIFDVKIKGSVNHFNYSVNGTHTIASAGALDFLVNNYHSGVIQIGYTGRPHDLSSNLGYGGGLALWGKPTGRSPLDGDKSEYAYITSLRDKYADELTKEHYLHVLPPYRNAASASLPDSLDPISSLYGLILYTTTKPDYTKQDVKYTYGKALAHEVGHILNLCHRKGYTDPVDDFDGLDEQPAGGETNTHSIPPGGYLGNSGTNFMDYTGGQYRFPEDIDLHQAIIMRSSTIF